MSSTPKPAISSKPPAFDFELVDKHTGGKPVFTQERYKLFLNQIEELKETGKVTLQGLDGSKTDVSLPKGEDIVIERWFNHRFRMAKDSLWDKHETLRFVPFYMTIKKRNTSLIENDLPTVEQWVPEWNKTWNASNQLEQINAIFKKHGSGMRKVTKIVCVGLGRIGNHAHMFALEERSYFQHKGADAIATIISEEQSKGAATPGKIKIYAEDPLYTPTDKSIISKCMDNEWIVTTEGQGWAEIDRNTLVLGVKMPDNVHVSEFSYDHTREEGPAGLFCDVLWVDRQLDPKLKLNCYENKESIWDAKPDTGKWEDMVNMQEWANDKVWRWKQKCTLVEFPDDGTMFCDKEQIEDSTGKPVLTETNGVTWRTWNEYAFWLSPE